MQPFQWPFVPVDALYSEVYAKAGCPSVTRVRP